MMFGRLHLFLATTCVASLFDTAFGQHCTQASWGSAFGAKFNLEPLTLTPNISDWTVTVEKPAYCGLVHGVFVTKACDYDVTPNIRFKKRLVVAIHRNGKTEHPGSVEITVFCALHRNIF